MVEKLPVLFEIKSDYEFYCYLKAHLPEEYTIVSEPQKSYYSEWDFHYNIYHKDVLVKECKGNFLDIKKGFLLSEAKGILKQLQENRDANWK